MEFTTRKALLCTVLLTILPFHRALSQDLQPIGTLAIPTVTEQPVQVFSAGVSYLVSTPAGSGGGAAAAGVANFSTFNLTKLVDGTSPRLLVSAASGQHFPQARIDFVGPDGAVLSSFELFDLVVLGAVVKSTLSGTSRALIEEVSLDYQRIRQTVNTPAGAVEACWDRAQNRAC